VLVLVVRRQLLPELFDLAQTDSLSGVANRRAFHEQARHRLEQAAERHHVNVLALIDVDRFKTINDTFGHAVGDEVVRYIADFLGQAVRRTDVVGRIGGDEFALLIDATPGQAGELLERLRAGVAAKPYKLPDGRSVPLSLSIGMASTKGTGGYRLQSLIELADASLYVAKDQGRNRVVHLEQQAPGEWQVGFA
jgi:diguanylate cyclase (GGDEF)-like protein